MKIAIVVMSISLGVFAGNGETAAEFVAGLENANCPKICRAYWDRTRWSIGYGTPSRKGERISQTEALQRLKLSLATAEQAVDRHVKVALNDNQRVALVSFVYNVGSGNFAKSALLKRLNGGDYACVPHELHRWTKTSGYEAGLRRRRNLESAMFVRR